MANDDRVGTDADKLELLTAAFIRPGRSRPRLSERTALRRAVQALASMEPRARWAALRYLNDRFACGPEPPPESSPAQEAP